MAQSVMEKQTCFERAIFTNAQPLENICIITMIVASDCAGARQVELANIDLLMNETRAGLIHEAFWKPK